MERRIEDCGKSMPAHVCVRFTAAIFAALLVCPSGATAQTAKRSMPAPPVTVPGTVQVAPVDVPYSIFASPQAQQRFIERLHQEGPPSGGGLVAQRQFYAAFNDKTAARMKALYPVEIESRTIAGVRTEVITPKGGLAARNRKRVLINLHGGAFMWGDGSGGEVESIPIASLGKITVITLSYRLGPENRFPAASEDVAAVYRVLLERYKPANIGIYGCSAGGILTAEAIAWFDKVHLPMPGAIGTLCGSIAPPDGDSAYIAPMLDGTKDKPGPIPIPSLPYFREADLHDPLVFPINSPSLLTKFPPTLLIAGSRDFSFSSLLKAQAALTAAGVAVDLHLWDGMWHAFFVNPDLPESREVYDVIIHFFDQHLGLS
jgi:monoterpene epsilon-lactone hydrolase